MKPKAWPEELNYITSYTFTKEAESLYKQILKNPLGEPTIEILHPNSLCHYTTIIKQITNTGHPAHGQLGLFTSQKIPARSHITVYIGKVHLNSESEESDYDLVWLTSKEIKKFVPDCKFNVDESLCIDAKSQGNEARFINDYRNISKRPNAEFKAYFVNGTLKLGIFSLSEQIKKGDELLVSYGKGILVNLILGFWSKFQ